MLRSIFLSTLYLISSSALSINTTSLIRLPPVRCYDPLPDLRPITLFDCWRAVDLIRSEPKSDVPRIWFRPTPDYMMVKKWTSGNCMIALSARTAMGRDMFTPKAIADSAWRVVDACLTLDDNFGGSVSVGPRELFDVMVSTVPTKETGVRSGNITSGVQLPEPDCWGFIPPRIPLSLIDCLAVVDLMELEPGYKRDRIWNSPDPEEADLVVKDWSAGTCVVVLSAKRATITDVFQPSAIVHAALELLYRCVTDGMYVGGSIAVGPRELFVATVRKYPYRTVPGNQSVNTE